MRHELAEKHGRSLRELYRTLEKPGSNPLAQAHSTLNSAVRAAYGMPPKANPLAFILDLNLSLALAEADGKRVQGPGLPEIIKDKSLFVTHDAIGR